MSRSLCSGLMALWLVGALGAAGAEKPAPPASEAKAVNGLKLVLSLDKTELVEGEPWTGKVTAFNVGDKPVVLFRLAEVKLTRTDRKPPKVVMSTQGESPDSFSPRQRCGTVLLDPGKSEALAVFGAAWPPDHTLEGQVGGLRLAWDLAAGSYRMSVHHSMTAELAAKAGKAGAWTGVVESNVVAVTVAPRQVAAKAVKGLRLLLDVRPAVPGRAGGPITGRARLVNVSAEAVLVDAHAELSPRFVLPDGRVSEGGPHPAPAGKAQDGDRYVRLAPNDWVTIVTFSQAEGAVLVAGTPAIYYALPDGRCRVGFIYRAAAPGPDAPGAWSGEVQSNDEEVLIGARPAPEPR